ncbi:MAG: hypothetical protein M3136_12045 [Thermoproteota archaeon]|nr:hypothetical protein [Thermoproteota archaeon]
MVKDKWDHLLMMMTTTIGDYEGEHMRLVKNTHTFCTGTKRALYTGYDG